MPLMRRRFKSWRGRSWWWWRGYADRKQQPVILLSDGFVAQAASVGAAVASLSVIHGSGTYTFSLTDDAGGLFAIDGTSLEVAGALSAGTESVTVEADNGVDDPVSRTFTITVA